MYRNFNTAVGIKGCWLVERHGEGTWTPPGKGYRKQQDSDENAEDIHCKALVYFIPFLTGVIIKHTDP